jgi:hypothetical protein
MSKKRYIELRWKLLEYKAAYYLPEKVHPSRLKDLQIPDVTYDALELEMIALGKRLGLDSSRILDFPRNSPSGQLVLAKLETDLNSQSNKTRT